MASKKGTKAYKSEYVYVHYGIHMESLEVETVWETRDGTLSRGFANHSMMPGRQARSEILVVFSIGNIKTISINMYDAHGSKIREELEAQALVMREERAVKAATSSTPNS